MRRDSKNGYQKDISVKGIDYMLKIILTNMGFKINIIEDICMTI